VCANSGYDENTRPGEMVVSTKDSEKIGFNMHCISVAMDAISSLSFLIMFNREKRHPSRRLYFILSSFYSK